MTVCLVLDFRVQQLYIILFGSDGEFTKYQRNAPFHTIFEYLWGSKWLSAEAEKWIRLFQFCLNINHNSYTQKFSFFSFFSKMEFFSYYYQIAIFLWNILVCRKHIDFEEKVFLFLVLEKCKHILKQITSPFLTSSTKKRRKKNSKCFSFLLQN